MPPTPKNPRFDSLRQVPVIAGLDHRYFIDKNGKDTRFKNLSRKERRKLAIESNRIGREYERIVCQFSKSGAGLPADRLLRELCLEYTGRYARTGIFSQPVNFNYFEPFCEIGLIKNSVALSWHLLSSMITCSALSTIWITPLPPFRTSGPSPRTAVRESPESPHSAATGPLIRSPSGWSPAGRQRDRSSSCPLLSP